MKLIHAEIYDFKSIKKEKLEIHGNQLCLVGKNESGKSSVIQAISYLNILDYELTNKQLSKSAKTYPSGLPTIIGTFELDEKGFSELSKLLANYLSEPAIIEIATTNTCFLQVKRWGNGISNISISLTDKESFGVKLTDLIDAKAKFYSDFFSTLYPTIEYYENEELLIEAASVEELSGNDKKFETFRRLLYIGGCKNISALDSPDDNFVSSYISQIEDNFNEVLKRHYKQDETISIRLQVIRGNKLSLVIKDGTKMSFSIEERSPGFKYYFSFLVNKLYTKLTNGNRNTVLLLDEPGGSLHPQGSKDLLKSFNDIAESTQIIYTTHNPFLAVRNCIDSLVFVAKSHKDGTVINKKSFLNKYQILRKELGILLNDSFLIGDINLVVEGNTEKLAFHRAFQIDKYADLQWLNIYNADGVSNVPQAINYLGKNNLNLWGIIVLDSDTEADEVKKTKFYKGNVDGVKWAAVEINDVFTDKRARTFEDLFPVDLYVTAFNQYCHSLKSLEIFDKAYVDFQIESPALDQPIVDMVKPHFKKFLPDNSNSSITKQDVIRVLLDNIEKLSDTEQKATLEKFHKLIDRIKTDYKKIERNANN